MKTKHDVAKKLHAELHDSKECRQGVTCRRLATARRLAPVVIEMLDDEVEETKAVFE